MFVQATDEIEFQNLLKQMKNKKNSRHVESPMKVSREVLFPHC